MNTKKIDKLIVRYVIEVCIAIFFIVLSYTGISSSDLKESSAIASFSQDGTYDMQYEFDRNTDDILALKNLLDRGVLTVRNPNSERKEIEISLIIYGNIENIVDLYVEFGEEKVDLTQIKKENDTSKLILSKTSLKGYDKASNSVSIYGNPHFGTTFAYDFEIIESFLA